MTEDELYQNLSDPKISILEKKKLQDQYNAENSEKYYAQSEPKDNK